MKQLALFVLCLLGGFATEGKTPEPRARFDFEKFDAKKRAVNVASKGMPFTSFGGDFVFGEGVDSSSAVHVTKGRCPQSEFTTIDFRAFTLDLKFKLDGAVDTAQGNALFSYSWAPWNRGNFMVRITRDSRVEVRFLRERRKDDPKIDWKVVSDVQEIAANVYNALRVSCSGQGLVVVYLNGVEIARKEGAPGLNGIRSEPPKWYPLVRLGADDGDTANFRSVLNGFVDDLEIYDVALGAPAKVVVPVDYSGVAAVAYRPDGARPMDVLVPDATGVAVTPKFRVLEREVGALGHWVKPEQKFLANAATAKFSLDEKTLEVVFTCPVPEGMEIKRRTNMVWAGDEVEFFIRPSLDSRRYHQYCVNTAGLAWGGRQTGLGASDKSFRTAFKSAVRDIPGGFEVTMTIPREEVFPKMPEPGDVFSVDFVRIGDTCYGMSTWADVGRAIHEQDRFGLVLWGGAKAYFGKRLEKARAKVAAFADPAARAAAEKAFAPLSAAVETRAGGADTVAALELMFADFDQAVVAISLAGQPLLVYAPDDPWGNHPEPTAATKPLDRIRLAVARNSKAYCPLALKNLTDREFLGQIKVFDRTPGFSFGKADIKDEAALRFTFLEAVPADIGGGSMSYDPFAPLPMNTLVRLPPKGCAPLWIEFDSRGLPAGRHSLVLRLKKSRMGFRSLTIPAEVTVVDKDLDTVPFDKAAYDQLYRPSARYDRMAEFAAEHCGNVMVTGSWPGAFAKKLKDGSWQKPDFAELDRRIDARLKGGVPKEKFVLWYCIALNLYWNGPKKANGSVNSDLTDPEWHEGMKVTVTALRDHLREKYGMGYGQLIFYVIDEPEADGNIDDPKLKDTMAIAYRSAKTIKEADPKLRTFTNPHTSGALKTDVFLKTLKRLEGVIDIIEFYRPNICDNHDFIAKLKDLKFEYWTYSILDTRTHPSVWRSDVWRNMRDGFRELTPYWHFDAMAGGDGFDPSDTGSAGGDYVDYGTAYVDYDQGRALGSRRLAAWELGLEDAKLIKFLRAKYAKDAAKLAEIEKIVKTAADKGDMKSMDHARGLLLRMGY